MVAATIAIVALAGLSLYWAASRGDAVSVARQIRTTERALDDVVARLAQEQEAVAFWDDPVVQLQKPRLDFVWLDENIGTWLHTVYHHDQTFILNARDAAIYANVGGTRVPASRYAAIRRELRPMVDEARGRIPENSDDRFDRLPDRAGPGALVLTTPAAIHSTHMMGVGGRPAAVSVMRIIPSTAGLRRPGGEPLLVSLRFLDGAFLAELQHRNLIDRARFSRSADPAPGEQALRLHSEDGAAIGYLIWHPELPGSHIIAALVPVTAVLILAMIGLMGLLARWLWQSAGELHETMVQLKASEAQAQHLAFHDMLTGLPNRALFNDRLDHALNGARRGGKLALLLLDLDRFKHVNDTLGHLAGDALIREFGARVASLVRDGDTVARLGGDEFVVLLPGMDRADDLDALCQRIHAAVHERFEVMGNSAFVGVSIGVITAPEFGLDRVELMRKGDIALYRAKAEGRDCHRSYSESMDERIQYRSAIEEDLRAALASGDQLRVHYQPEMGGDGGMIVGLEALVRWQHPARGLISPEQFVPIAEETGLICELGEWVLREACKAARRWPDLFVAVNLSPAQFRVSGFAERLIDIVGQEKVNAKQIELEVTEGVLLADDDLVLGALAALRSAGFRIALDDFGTGYSSFSYLRKFEVDKIKIDRSFVQHLGHRVDSAALVAAVVTIGHAMGLTVTAEGVETNEQRRLLALAGCNQMQGFLFSRALPEDEIARLLLARTDGRDAA
jgi:diguanylate cyclase (GGDEF)-like protein